MNLYSQLTQLIFDFYREDPQPLQQLQPLRRCKLSRWWGSFNIRCFDLETANELIAAQSVLLEPIAQLRLAHQIKILLNRDVLTVVPLHGHRSSSRSNQHLWHDAEF